MTPKPLLVLIVNYRTAKLVLHAIEAIADEVRGRGDAQILVVDNGSGDGSAEMLAEAVASAALRDICKLLALEENAGFAAGNNAGLSYYRDAASATGLPSSPAFTWLLNPDTVPEPGALAVLVDFLDSHPTAGIAGGLCLNPDGSPHASAFRFHRPFTEFIAALDFGPLRRKLARHDVVIRESDRPIRAEWVSGAHFLVRGAVFDRIGAMDPGYFLYFEETDLCARAADAGFEIWSVPASRVMHIGGQSTGAKAPSKRRPRYWFASRARFLLRRHGVAKTHLANLLWLLAYPPGTLIALLRGRPRSDPPRLWRDFLMIYYGPGGLMYRPAAVAA